MGSFVDISEPLLDGFQESILGLLLGEEYEAM